MLGKGTATSKYPKRIANDVKVKWKKDSIRCSLPWKELRVTYKGDVFACCWGLKPIPNLKDESMSGTWNGEAMRRMRRDLVDGKVPDVARSADAHGRARRSSILSDEPVERACEDAAAKAAVGYNFRRLLAWLVFLCALILAALTSNPARQNHLATT
jgi:hypothetical protein